MADCECFNQIMDYLRLNLPGALDTTIELEISNMLDEFFTKTNAWVERVKFNTRAGKKEYAVSPGNGITVRLMRVATGEDTNVPASMPTIDTLLLREDPGATLPYYAYFATKQKAGEGLDQIPEWVYNNYRMAIQYGTIGRMMAQPAKPYSNEKLAIFNMREYSSQAAQIRADVAQQHLYRGQVWRYPQGFARGSQR